MFRKSKTSSDVTVIGIWLHEVYPGGFTGEGMSRLLVWIVRAAQLRSDIKLKVACVTWVKEPFKRHLSELGVDVSKLEFITVPGLIPLLNGFYLRWEERSKRKKTPRTWVFQWDGWKNLVTVVFSTLISLPIIIGLPLILLLVVVTSPILAIWLIADTLSFLSRWMKDKIVFLRRVVNKLRNMVLKRVPGLSPADIIKSPFAILEHRGSFLDLQVKLGKRIYRGLIHLELEALAQKAGRDKKVQGWFLAYPNNMYTARFKVPIIQAVPDIVYMDFPTPFAAEIPGLLKTHNQIEETVRRAQSAITYSDFVKMQQVVGPGYQPAERVYVIRHAPISTRELLTSDTEIAIDKLKHQAADIIREYLTKMRADDRRTQYIKALPFGDFNYLFVSSQTRPHKNHFNLIKVFERLLRDKYFNIKLIFTGQFTPEMEDYIWERKLHLDVLSIPHLPAVPHAAFYACARMSIAPTLFEGGFPFVFSESLSVGTPSLLSNIPVVQELLSPEQSKMVCFDPYDMDNMLERITWGLGHHQELLEFENGIHAEMKKRTWNDVASEYISVFKATIVKGMA